MVRALFGVVLSGTLLLGWCWYYSDQLPQHLQQAGVMPAQTVDNAQAVAPAAEDESEPVVTPVTFEPGPLAFQMFQQDADGNRDYRQIGLGLASCLGAALVASLLLMMAGLRNYVARVGFVVLLGSFAAVLVMCDYLFWHQPWEATAYKSVFFVSGALIAGIVLAIFVRPQPTPLKVPVRVR